MHQCIVHQDSNVSRAYVRIPNPSIAPPLDKSSRLAGAEFVGTSEAPLRSRSLARKSLTVRRTKANPLNPREEQCWKSCTKYNVPLALVRLLPSLPAASYALSSFHQGWPMYPAVPSFVLLRVSPVLGVFTFNGLRLGKARSCETGQGSTAPRKFANACPFSSADMCNRLREERPGIWATTST